MALERLTTFIYYIFQNKQPGITDATRRADGARVMANFYALLRAMGFQARAYGANLTDAGSDDTTCQVNVLDVSGHGGLVDAGDICTVWDSTGREWQNVAASNDVLSFGGAHQVVEGGGWMTTGYSAPGFIATLDLVAEGAVRHIGASRIILDPDAADPLTAADIPLAAGGADLLGATFDTLKTAFESYHDGETGGHAEDAIDATALKSSGFLDESFSNILWGGMDYDDDGDGFPNGWRAYNGATSVMMLSGQRIGESYPLVTATGVGQGIESDPATYDYRDYLGDVVSFAPYLYTFAPGVTVTLEIDDGITTTTAGPFASEGAWSRPGMVAHEVDPGATQLLFRAYSSAAMNFGIDGAMGKRGRVPVGYADHPVEAARRPMRSEDQTNWFPNSDMRVWTNGYSALPDYYLTGAGGINAPDSVARNTSQYLFGDASLQLELTMGEGVYWDVWNLVDWLNRAAGGPDGRTVLSVYLTCATGGGEGILRLKIDDGVAPQYVDMAVDDGYWYRPRVAIQVDVLATMLRCSLEHRDAGAGTIDVCVDGFMLTKGGWPGHGIAWRPATVYHPFERVYAHPGALDTGLLFHHGADLDIFPVDRPCYIDKILAHAITAPGVGVGDAFTAQVDGAPSTLAVTLATAANDAKAHVPAGIAVAQGSLLQVGATASGSPAEDVGVTVGGFIIAR